MNRPIADNRDAKLVALAEEYKRAAKKGRRFVYARAMKLITAAGPAADDLLVEFDKLIAS